MRVVAVFTAVVIVIYFCVSSCYSFCRLLFAFGWLINCFFPRNRWSMNRNYVASDPVAFVVSVDSGAVIAAAVVWVVMVAMMVMVVVVVVGNYCSH